MATSSHQQTRNRAESPELGHEPSKLISKRTGLPIRASVSRKRSLPDYLDTNEAVTDSSASWSSSEDDGEDSGPRMKRRKLQRRPPSPTPPPLEPALAEGFPALETNELSTSPHLLVDGLSLTFNIPLDFQGPLTIQLNRDLIEKVVKGTETRLPNKAGDGTVKVTKSAQRGDRDIVEASLTNVECMRQADAGGVHLRDVSQEGFLKLPPELRNKIYRLLFVTGKDIKFGNPKDWRRSSEFLRTCRQVHVEGASLLYGENKFVFTREHKTRAPYWQQTSLEIGFKDVRRFLSDIGTRNLSMIKNIDIFFEDARPSTTPYLRTVEERRFVHDEQLIQTLHLLARHSRLQELGLHFYGRRQLLISDQRFVEALTAIKADKVDMIKCVDESFFFYGFTKIHPAVEKVLVKDMTRKEKMYAV